MGAVPAVVLPPLKVEKCGHRRPFGWPIIRIIMTMLMQPPVVVVAAVGLEGGVSAEAVRGGRQWQGYCIGLGQGAVSEGEEEGVCRGLVGMACR